MKIGSLFSGIGGLELGLERAGLGSVAWQVERDAYCRHILARHWPDVPRFDDVRTVGAHNLPRVDVLCGGFPCQDLSAAGKGAGLAGDRSGLWFEMRRIIDELRPTWVVVENVAHTWRKYVPVVRRALWELGYASLPLRVRACDVGARHERARILLVAGPPDTDLFRRPAGSPELSGLASLGSGRSGDAARCAGAEGGPAADVDRVAVRLQSERQAPGWLDVRGSEEAEPGEDAADPSSDGRREGRPGRLGESAGRAEHSDGAAANNASLRLPFGGDLDGDLGEERAPAGGSADDGAGLVSPGFGLSPRPWMVRGVHGLPRWVDGARGSGWTPARIREARIHGLGNAVVPQVAEAVGRLIVASVRASVAA